MHDIYVIGAILAVFSVVQSLFGMGVLVFGTPTLLLLGMDFISILGWLLPSSVAISMLQVFRGHGDKGQDIHCLRVHLVLVGVPLVASLSLAILLHVKSSVEVWVGLAMLSAAALKQSWWLKTRFTRLVNRYKRMYLVIMGAFHGMTNMGGALLAIYAASTNQDKHGTRLIVAKFYLLFGAIQLATLLMLQRSAIHGEALVLALVSGMIYLMFGNAAFSRVGADTYERAFTGFIAAYGVALLLKNSLLL